MKKITLIGTALLCLSQFSCKEDFLVTTDPTRIGADLFYKNETQFLQALNGVYGQLQTITNSAYIFQEFTSDNTTIDFNPLDRGGAAGWEAFEYSTVNPGNGEISNMWNQYYSAMYNINYALEKLGPSTIDATVKKQVEGQLKFLRAYFYFHLVQYFGDVVLVTSTLDKPERAFDLVRSPEAEVYKQIEKDLKEAADLLPQTYPANQAGRVTKGAALSLLGKMYLTRKQYAEAVTTLKQVTTLGYSLLPKYADNFDPTKKNGPESIFEVQYQGGNDLGEHSNFMYVFAPRLSGAAVTGFSTAVPLGRNIPTNDIIAAYEEGDLRKDASLKTGYTLNGKLVPVPFVSKYQHPHTIAGRTDNNWPVLRYADVLLMLAEAINEQTGPTAEALDYLNKVRTRAGLAPLGSDLDKEKFRTAVLKERRVELAFENHRWFDLKRTMTPAQLAAFMNAHGAKEKAKPTVDRGGIAFNALDYVFENHEYYFPIPAPQILINNKLAQNPGY
ncbi:RagB/SusD family nutrient uptake outer membrane protein [Nibrella viscosa]|uniref:RagB/SusD family nutrient uptake outer membrane protein n=1 Tax=Nibrella viscosa TaxID=1084524 RepID=A0ABP8KH42_9BACT